VDGLVTYFEAERLKRELSDNGDGTGKA
jgi:hypothetical protein